MTTPSQREQQLGAYLRRVSGRLTALEDEAANRARGLRELWGALGRLEQRLAKADRRIVALERELGGRRDLHRVPLNVAAKMLGASRQHVLRLGLAGELEVLDVREPDAARAVWTVSLGSIERLLEQRDAELEALRDERLGPVGRENRARAGRARTTE